MRPLPKGTEPSTNISALGLSNFYQVGLHFSPLLAAARLLPSGKHFEL
jgi:hypothetical protein